MPDVKCEDCKHYWEISEGPDEHFHGVHKEICKKHSEETSKAWKKCKGNDFDAL